MSSSPIVKFLVSGLTGPRGSAGPAGRTGATGPTGATGQTGPIGRYFTSSSAVGNNIYLTFSDGSTATISGNFRGPTFSDKTLGLVKGSNTGSTGFGTLVQVVGGTFQFKGISASGSLRASLTGPNNEYISIDSIYWGKDLPGNFNAASMSVGRILYLGDPFTAFGDGITHPAITTSNISRGYSGAFNFQFTSSDDTSYHLNAGANIVSLGPIRKGLMVGYTGGQYNPSSGGSTSGIFIDANAGGAFILHTPIGIRGISGNFRTNEINSITLLIDSDDVWNFPSNVYFEPDENYLSCGKNIIGLMTYDGGNTWLATVSHRGHGIENPERQCIPGYLFGSCCYTNADGTLECLDYTTRSTCDKLFGNFNAAKSCEESCGSDVGICCSGGNCIENVSVTLCERFGGQYWSGVKCSDYNPGGSNYPEGDLSADELKASGRFCYDQCSDVKTVCCKNGQCLGNYTRVQCELILGGKSLTAATCAEADCCDYSTVAGACCKCTTTGTTTTSECLGVLSYTDCKNAGGIFMGPGKQCNEVSCGCVCGGGSGGGTTGSTGGQDTTTGICCKDGTCLPSANNKTACDAACGNWLSSIEFYANNNYKRYTFESPTDCEVCAMARPFMEFADAGSCFPSVSLGRMNFDSSSSCFTDSGPSPKFDLFFNQYGFIPELINTTKTTTREQFLELLCDLSTNTIDSVGYGAITSLYRQVYEKWAENNFSTSGNCANIRCCECSSHLNGVLVNCQPAHISPSWDNYCSQQYCGGGVPGSPGGSCSGLGTIGGGEPPNTEGRCDLAKNYCSIPITDPCTCGNFTGSLDANVKNVKMYLNSTDYICVPIVCEDCSGYELCGES